MSVRFSSFFVCLLVTIYSGDADPVSFIKKCKSGDTACLKDSTQSIIPIYTAGIPELKVSPLDPLTIKKLNASSNGLNLILKDMTITGLKGCIVKKMKWDLSPYKLQAQVLCDINLDGQYTMSGRLLIVPIEGDGDVHVTLRKILLTVDAYLEEKLGKDDGKNHWNIKSWSHNFDLKDKANVNFENLFNGNEVLGQAARDIIKNNPNEIVTTVGPPVIKGVVSKLISNINKFFHTVPYEDLVDIQ